MDAPAPRARRRAATLHRASRRRAHAAWPSRGRPLFRDAVGREPSQPALVELPAPGRLLVLSPEGAWVVKEDGSKRLLGAYEDASWSPRGLYVIATQGRQLVAIDPESGEPRWSLSRTEPVSDPRWSGGGLDTRIAYRAGDTLHVVAGDGSPDSVVADGVAPLAPAWMPTRTSLPTPTQRATCASSTRIRVGSSGAQGPSRASASWRSSGTGLPSRPGRGFSSSAGGRKHRSSGCQRVMSCSTRCCCPTAECSTRTTTPGRTRPRCSARIARWPEPAGSCRTHGCSKARDGSRTSSPLPDLAWIAAGWPAADQFLFKSAPRRLGKVDAVSNVTGEFSPGGGTGAFPIILGWAQPAP